jgi:serine/threonine protein kinase
VTGGELFDLIVNKDHFNEDLTRDYFFQMLEATQYLHRQGVLYIFMALFIFVLFICPLCS